MLWHCTVRDRENLWLSANQAELKGHVTMFRSCYINEKSTPKRNSISLTCFHILSNIIKHSLSLPPLFTPNIKLKIPIRIVKQLRLVTNPI